MLGLVWMYKMVSEKKAVDMYLPLGSMNYSTGWTDYANPRERIDQPRELIINKRKWITSPRERFDKQKERITDHTMEQY